MFRYVVNIYGIGLMKVLLVSVQLVGICIYGIKNFKNDLEFMSRTKLYSWINIVWLFASGIAIVGVIVKLMTTMDLFYYNRKAIPSWAIGSNLN